MVYGLWTGVRQVTTGKVLNVFEKMKLFPKSKRYDNLRIVRFVGAFYPRSISV